MSIWNPWHGCKKLSPGCENCYVYRRDESIGKDASIVSKTGDFNLPLRKNKKGEYKLTAADGVVYTCMTSDFFLPERDDLTAKLARSDFRSRFKLTAKDKEYLYEKGLDTIKSHAEDFVGKRMAPENPENDGKQTPMKGHPVFIAQHATACCCRGCLEKWHNIPAGKILTLDEQAYVVDVIMEWIKRNG